MTFVKTELREQIGWITMDHDAKRNALSFALLTELLAAFKVMKEAKARVIILRANKGAKVWSSGFFIDELPRDGSDPLAYDNPLQKVIRTIQSTPVPVICLAEGSIWGGACNIAFVCDIVIGTKDTCLAITPAKIGVPYNTSGILQFLDIIGSHIVKEMFFTASPISAEKALDLGIINHLVAPEEMEEFTIAMARKIIANSPLSIQVIKEQLTILGNALPMTPQTFEHIDMLRRIAGNSDDYLEGIKAFYEKRTPAFNGK
ncbi:MAG TPA: methylmalonyl-CoA decarboxylase [Bacteroidales bacterium]|nr:methylmalonyl-CoA decarboxylase [Bacteroidales bacterium]HPT08929.1 methylmalonyl-CoA decarboxylase [Bacteroidales bacterium]